MPDRGFSAEVQKLRDLWSSAEARHLGLPRALGRSFYHRVNCHVAARIYRFVRLTVDRADRELSARSAGFECRMLARDEIERLADDPLYAGGTVVRDALGRGDLCQAIVVGDVLANIGWYANAPTEIDDLVRVDFDRHYLYMHHGYTWPAFRGGNLHGIGLARALEDIVQRGFAGLVGVAERVNFASLRSAHRTGFRDCGTALVVGTHARVRCFSTPAAHRAGFRLAPLRGTHGPTA